MFSWQFLKTYIFPILLKFGACYITDHWGEFRVDDLSNFCNKMLTNQKPKFVLLKFCWNFADDPYLPISIKACVGFFLILFRTWIICQNQKIPGFYTLRETRLINNSIFKQNLKNPRHAFLDICKTETCEKFLQKNNKLYSSWSSSKFSIFQTNNLVSRKYKNFA